MYMKKVMFWLLLSLLLPTLLLSACSSDGGEEDASSIVEENDVPEGAPRLTSLTLDGGYDFRFLPGKRTYQILLPEGNPYLPQVTASPEKGAEMTVEQAMLENGASSCEARVHLSKDGIETTYTVTFVKNRSSGFELAYDDRYRFSVENGEAVSFESSDPTVIAVDASGLAVVKQVSDSPVTITGKNSAGEIVGEWTVNRTVKAVLDLFVIAGQSNAAGEGGNAEESVKPEEGTVYLADAQGTSMMSLSGGKSGFAAAFGQTWHQKTGRKVLFVQATATGRGADSWAPGGEIYAEMENDLDACVAMLKESPSYLLRSTACLFMQGEWDMAAGTDEVSYEKNVLLLRDALKSRYDIGGFGLIPARSWRMESDAESVALGIMSDMLPVRAAQYTLCREQSDILLLTRVSETASADNGLMQEDNMSFTQRGYNRIGQEAAETFIRWMSPDADKAVTSFTLLSENGRDALENGSELVLAPGSSYRLTPLCEPYYADIPELKLYVSDERLASVDRFGLLTIHQNAQPQTMTVKAVCGAFSVEVTVRIAEEEKVETHFTKVEYGWRFDGSLDEKEGLNSLTRSELSPSEGGYEFYDNSVFVKKDRSVDFELEKPIRLSSSFAWSIQWRGNLYGDSCLLGQNYDTAGYIYLAPWSDALGHAIRFVTEAGTSFLIPYGDFAEKNKEVCSWILSYDPDSRMVSLQMNDSIVSEVAAPSFDVTFTNLFGRYGSENANINFAGELDWLKIVAAE